MGVRMICFLVAVASTAGLRTRVDPRDENSRLPSPAHARRKSDEEVKIINFIDTKNEDGSYTFGFEAQDGSYKVETRAVTGEVWGKYGYIDPSGVLREATYGVSLKSKNPSKSQDFSSYDEIDNSIDSAPASIPKDVDIIASKQEIFQLPMSEIREMILEKMAAEELRVQNTKPVSSVRSAYRDDYIEETRRSSNLKESRREGRVKIINGRRAILRKKVRKLPVTVYQKQQQEKSSSRQLVIKKKVDKKQALPNLKKPAAQETKKKSGFTKGRFQHFPERMDPRRYMSSQSTTVVPTYRGIQTQAEDQAAAKQAVSEDRPTTQEAQDISVKYEFNDLRQDGQFNGDDEHHGHLAHNLHVVDSFLESIHSDPYQTSFDKIPSQSADPSRTLSANQNKASFPVAPVKTTKSSAGLGNLGNQLPGLGGLVSSQLKRPSLRFEESRSDIPTIRIRPHGEQLPPEEKPRSTTVKIDNNANSITQSDLKKIDTNSKEYQTQFENRNFAAPQPKHAPIFQTGNQFQLQGQDFTASKTQKSTTSSPSKPLPIVNQLRQIIENNIAQADSGRNNFPTSQRPVLTPTSESLPPQEHSSQVVLPAATLDISQAVPAVPNKPKSSPVQSKIPTAVPAVPSRQILPATSRPQESLSQNPKSLGFPRRQSVPAVHSTKFQFQQQQSSQPLVDARERSGQRFDSFKVQAPTSPTAFASGKQTFSSTDVPVLNPRQTVPSSSRTPFDTSLASSPTARPISSSQFTSTSRDSFSQTSNTFSSNRAFTSSQSAQSPSRIAGPVQTSTRAGVPRSTEPEDGGAFSAWTNFASNFNLEDGSYTLYTILS